MGADALPLLAFTLFLLYRGFSAGGSITLEHYNLIGGTGGSIKAAIKEALAGRVFISSPSSFTPQANKSDER